MENKVLAVVNGVKITENDLRINLMRYPEDKRDYFQGEEGKKQLLEQVISFELLYNYANDANLENHPSYAKRMETMRKELLVQIAVEKALDVKDPTDEEIEKYYEENKEQFRVQETASAKHILVDTLEQAKEIKKKIDEGMKMEDAAKEFSKCPSKSKGGSLGTFPKGAMVPEFEKAVFEDLKIGEISEPVKTQFGYHIIKVEEKNQSEIKPLKEVAHIIRGKLLYDRQGKSYQGFINELKAKYPVEIK